MWPSSPKEHQPAIPEARREEIKRKGWWHLLEVRRDKHVNIFNLCNSSAATQPSWIIPAITGFFTGSAAIAASYVQGRTHIDLEKLKIKSKQSKTKKQLYSDLLGYRFLL